MVLQMNEPRVIECYIMIPTYISTNIGEFQDIAILWHNLAKCARNILLD